MAQENKLTLITLLSLVNIPLSKVATLSTANIMSLHQNCLDLKRELLIVSCCNRLSKRRTFKHSTLQVAI